MEETQVSPYFYISDHHYFLHHYMVLFRFNLMKKWQQLNSSQPICRALSAPTFSVSSLKKIRPVVEDSVMNMVRIMEERHANGGSFNIHQ